MKYIDADKLIANLERQNVDKKVIQPLIRIIDSLQQEQNSIQDTELTGFESALFTAFSYAWQSYLRGEEVDVVQWVKDCSKDLLEAAGCQQEQQEVDLDKEMSRFIRTYFAKPEYDKDVIAEVDWENSMRECARHFYELGKNNK